MLNSEVLCLGWKGCDGGVGGDEENPSSSQHPDEKQLRLCQKSIQIPIPLRNVKNKTQYTWFVKKESIYHNHITVMI